MADDIRSMRPRLDLRLQQKLIMTPQLQQAIRLLQLSRLEMNQMITQEIMENPLLEDIALETSEEETSLPPESDTERREEDSQFKEVEQVEEFGGLSFKWDEYLDEDSAEGSKEPSYYRSSSEDLPSYEQTLTKPTSLVDHLLWQLSLYSVTEAEKRIGTIIVGNLDDDGYLRTPMEEIGVIAGCGADEVEKVLELIQTFDPQGVGARDLKECLLIQIEQLGLQGTLISAVIEHHLGDLENKKYAVIGRSLGVSVEEVFQASKVIEHLEPKPGRPFSSTENLYIIPDVFVVKLEGNYVVILNDDGLPRLRINPYYKRLLRSKETATDLTKAYVEDKLRSARWLIRSIEQRNRTICRVSESIVKFQRDFFDRGIGYLKPLVLKQVADDISMHESTISRVTTHKYMYTPQGIFELKFFFNSSVPRLGGEGESLSSVTVREMIRKMVVEEDPKKPLTDQEIVEALKLKNIGIARRTVAKYRAWLNIPSASKRKTPF
jgi:RNA polymerase sigma-54 factor